MQRIFEKNSRLEWWLFFWSWNNSKQEIKNWRSL